MLEKITVQLKAPICRCKIPYDGAEYTCNVGITNRIPHLEIGCVSCGSKFIVSGSELRVYIEIKNLPAEQIILPDFSVQEKPIKKFPTQYSHKDIKLIK